MATRLMLAAWVLEMAALAVAPGGATENDPTLHVHGVGLHSPLADITKALGAPVEEIRLPDDGLGMGPGVTFVYPGLKVDLCRPPQQAEYRAWRLVATGAQWIFDSEVRVGMTRTHALRVLGPPADTKTDASGRETLHYSFSAFDGFYWVSLDGGTVVEIGVAEDWS